MECWAWIVDCSVFVFFFFCTRVGKFCQTFLNQKFDCLLLFYFATKQITLDGDKLEGICGIVNSHIFWFVSLSVCLSKLARANFQQFTFVENPCHMHKSVLYKKPPTSARLGCFIASSQLEKIQNARNIRSKLRRNQSSRRRRSRPSSKAGSTWKTVVTKPRCPCPKFIDSIDTGTRQPV